MRIRQIRRDDKQRLAIHFETLSPESRYWRFHGLRKCMTAQELTLLTDPDFVNHVVLVATIGKGAEQIVGDGRYVRLPNSREAELALSVNDGFQRIGIGTLLLNNLTRCARLSGVKELTAEIMGSNTRAMRFLLRRGFQHIAHSNGIYTMALLLDENNRLASNKW